MLEARIFTRLDEAAELETAWRALAAGAQTGGAFQGPAFALTWWKHFGGDGNVLLAACFDGDALVGAAPLYRANDRGVRVLQVVGDRHCGDPAWLIGPDRDAEPVCAAILDALGAERWDALRFYGFKDPALSGPLAASAASAGLVPMERSMGGSYFIDLSGCDEAVLAGFSSKLKNTLKKRRRKAEKKGALAFEAKSTMSPDEFRAVLAVERDSWKSEAEFRLNREQAFFGDAFARLSESGELRFSRLLLDDVLAAYLVSLHSARGRVLAYETAYAQACKDASPGSLIHFEEIKALAGLGAAEIDFLGGGEGYKAQWTQTTRPVRELVLLRPGPRARWYGRGYYGLKWWWKERRLRRAAAR